MSLHAKHIRKVHAYLFVTCHLHIWQNDRGLLRVTAASQFDTVVEADRCLAGQFDIVVEADR